MPPVSVLPSVLPRRPTGVIFEGTSAEPIPYPPTIEPFELKGSGGMHPKREVDLYVTLGRFWEAPLSTYTSSPSSTVGELVRNLWTAKTTSTFIVHTPLLIAGADLSPSFATYLSNVTATTPATLEVRREYLKARFSLVLFDARVEEFEFGADSHFSQRIGQLVLRFGGEALGTLAAMIAESRTPLPILGELFRTLGRIRSMTTHDDRRAVLLRFLAAPDIRVRHVAATGLAELDDPAAIPALQTALTAERSERLRSHFRLVLDQLQATDVALRHR